MEIGIFGYIYLFFMLVSTFNLIKSKLKKSKMSKLPWDIKNGRDLELVEKSKDNEDVYKVLIEEKEYMLKINSSIKYNENGVNKFYINEETEEVVLINAITAEKAAFDVVFNTLVMIGIIYFITIRD